ncbi:hypothetical protein N658DRAFT_420302 [Parathielavia hyrcaniae]|uniref:Uncharacterized protein n=1 Tax=Parathielavia hyrcaniae TaxID=113614 RepID=A0AAN6Q5R0_9PEZI|nr:hypothetical protein N658DRAFT_420302 [Parathielavia hyrcaniae]
MANPFVYGGSAFPYEDVPFHNTPYGGLDISPGDSNTTYIDPSLQSCSPTPYANTWAAPVQQPFKHPSHKALFVADMSRQGQAPNHTPSRPTLGIPSASLSQVRFPSPNSSTEPSSSGSAMSPRADSDSFYDGFPMTPPDTAFSPSQPPMPLEDFAHAMQFRSMGPQDCVNPVDVNPTQQPEYCDNENSVIDFNLSPPGYRFGSQVSDRDAEAQNTGPLDFTRNRASPEPMQPMIKDKSTCATTHGHGHGPSASPSSFNEPNNPHGSIFNRKDLFTQHLKRMHAPREVKDALADAKRATGSGGNKRNPNPSSSSSSSSPTTSAIAAWNARVTALQATAEHPRCELPTEMRCPVARCAAGPFRGREAWNQRMEHVAKHMDLAAQGRELRVVFGGQDDPTLVEWASQRDVAIIVPAGGGGDGGGSGWVLKSPLKRGPGGNVVVTAPVRGQGLPAGGEGEEIVVVQQDGDGDGEEEDAEGEEDD